MKTIELEARADVNAEVRRPASVGSARVEAGDVVPRRALTAISGARVPVPDPEQRVHLQFRRFAGCPICDLHLSSFVRRHEELARAGIREVVVFHSPASELARHASDLPFAVVADPHKELYGAFRVGTSLWSLLDPRAWAAIARGVAFTTWGILRGRKFAPSLHLTGGRLGLPADFLIDRDGTVLASKYGVHAYDQWSIDEVLALATTVPGAATRTESPADLGAELRRRIRALPGVSERKNAGIHEDAFFVRGTMFMHIHGRGHCDIRLSKPDQETVLAEARAQAHRWAPQAGYVTFTVEQAKDLEPALELIRMSHRHFAERSAGKNKTEKPETEQCL